MTKRTTPRPNIDDALKSIKGFKAPDNWVLNPTDLDSVEPSIYGKIRVVVELIPSEVRYLENQIQEAKLAGNRKMNRSEYIRQLIHKDAEEKRV